MTRKNEISCIFQDAQHLNYIIHQIVVASRKLLQKMFTTASTFIRAERRWGYVFDRQTTKYLKNIFVNFSTKISHTNMRLLNGGFAKNVNHFNCWAIFKIGLLFVSFPNIYGRYKEEEVLENTKAAEVANFLTNAFD